MTNINPFKIESDNKKFFTDLASSPLESISEVLEQDSSNRIKRINE